MKGGKGDCRPTRRNTDKIQETHWLKYERTLQERAHMIQEKLGSKKPSDKLRIIQSELTKAAAEVAGHATEMRVVRREKQTDISIGKRRGSTKKKEFGKEREIKYSYGADTCITPGGMRGVKENKGDSRREKRSD
eukprot:6176598-Pleurochrysis_carterae.AAC.2